jgi:hypothetical protein
LLYRLRRLGQLAYRLGRRRFRLRLGLRFRGRRRGLRRRRRGLWFRGRRRRLRFRGRRFGENRHGFGLGSRRGPQDLNGYRGRPHGGHAQLVRHTPGNVHNPGRLGGNPAIDRGDDFPTVLGIGYLKLGPHGKAGMSNDKIVRIQFVGSVTDLTKTA